ncbi:MAG TPA: hypothetical protein VMD05_00130 [Candidatus Nanoarchaeia archaeon]|nr:hypothetical protein [Candidatus Nanoarchaeia archaeon]
MVEVLTKIYWIRVATGALAGLVSAAVVFLFQSLTPSTTIVKTIGSINTLLNGITIALLFYLISYYVLKAKYATKIEKQSKIMSMGIFIYFFTWLIIWVLTLSLVIGHVT